MVHPWQLDTIYTGWLRRAGPGRVLETHTQFSAEQKLIPARGKAVIDTQISIAVPNGTYGRVAPRSGLGERHLAKAPLLPATHGGSSTSCEVRY